VPTDTDIRLRSWLDTNQRDREQMCRSVLALDPHYSDVRPRHPGGGPDGGRDIEALFDGDRVAYGAVGFQNGANDSEEQKRTIRAKFTSDLTSALRAKPDLEVFLFLTNLHFTMGEQSEMAGEARKSGIKHCDILDRERLRIELDSPSGFFIRFQHLAIPLSEAEQASFLARYGDRIQEVVSTGFQRIERTLNRILFLQESADVLSDTYVRFQLNKSYPAAEIGHFRAFVLITLRAVKHDIWTISFGSSDKANRFRDDHKDEWKREPGGIAHGIGGGQWERHLKVLIPRNIEKEDQAAVSSAKEVNANEVEHELVQVGSSSSIGVNPVKSIGAHYSHDDPVIRFRPRLQLWDLNECFFMPVLNRSLAEKLHSIQVFANAYKLADIRSDDFTIDGSPFEGLNLPERFTPDELADPWVRIRPSNWYSAFRAQVRLDNSKTNVSSRGDPRYAGAQRSLSDGGDKLACHHLALPCRPSRSGEGPESTHCRRYKMGRRRPPAALCFCSNAGAPPGASFAFQLWAKRQRKNI
jgi:hypothetical protein